jgi:hypothetical protein
MYVSTTFSQEAPYLLDDFTEALIYRRRDPSFSSSSFLLNMS